MLWTIAIILVPLRMLGLVTSYLLYDVYRRRGTRFGAGALLLPALCVCLMGPGCGNDFNARIACQDYCTKKFSCENRNPTGDETRACVGACRNSIENNCGNEHQAAATEKIEECVDKGCVEFLVCLVFSAAPACFGFVSR